MLKPPARGPRRARDAGGLAAPPAREDRPGGRNGGLMHPRLSEMELCAVAPVGIIANAKPMTIPLERGMLRSVAERANRGFQRRTALRTRRSIAASRRTSWPRGRRCVQWADRREADPASRSRW